MLLYHKIDKLGLHFEAIVVFIFYLAHLVGLKSMHFQRHIILRSSKILRRLEKKIQNYNLKEKIPDAGLFTECDLFRPGLNFRNPCLFGSDPCSGLFCRNETRNDPVSVTRKKVPI